MVPIPLATLPMLGSDKGCASAGLVWCLFVNGHVALLMSVDAKDSKTAEGIMGVRGAACWATSAGILETVGELVLPYAAKLHLDLKLKVRRGAEECLLLAKRAAFQGQSQRRWCSGGRKMKKVACVVIFTHDALKKLSLKLHTPHPTHFLSRRGRGRGPVQGGKKNQIPARKK